MKNGSGDPDTPPGSRTEVKNMKLHWSPRSPYVRKVMIAANEVGIADRLDCVRTVVSTLSDVSARGTD
jgi:hypothetical protein